MTEERERAGSGEAAAEAAMREIVGDEAVMRTVGDRLDAGDDLTAALRAAAEAHAGHAEAIRILLSSPGVLDDLDAMLAMLLGTGSDVEGRPGGPRGGSLP